MPIKGMKDVKLAIGRLVESKNDKLRVEIVRTFSNVVVGTPVDTGRARANWFYSEKKPSTKKTKSTSASKEGSKVHKIILGKKIFFTNNLPYIEALEYGHSKQAPKGWVRVAIKRLGLKVRKL